MKKSDKKIDNSLRLALTEVCETAIDEVTGFKWLTHFANFRDFPGSLSVVCVFDTNDNLSSARQNHKADFLFSLIKEKLSAVNIQIKDMRPHVGFDTEEACDKENGGRWNDRFGSYN
jgi:hypothetical protein